MTRRFGRERQILALARHPDIARLLDGGATDDGHPCFAMEYVEGSPVDRYCDDRRLDVDARLRLFLRVARAVAYAHHNLVVHRDIKPSNILVSADGDVKLLDFGIAKVLDAGEEGELTRLRVGPMTPSWASPEQVGGAAVTTASDIYQLGLLLYHLLTGRAPYPVDTTSRESLERAIRETAPMRPSSALGGDDGNTLGDGTPPSPEETGRTRSTSPVALRRKLAGDLDNIVLKALRKEPDRRYGSVEQLADDLESYLEGRPVSARPDTFAYRLSRFVGRHRAASAAAGLALALLVAFAVTMAIQADRIGRERDRAGQEAETAGEVADFLVELFRVSDPGEARGSTVTAREILDRGTRRIEDELADRPDVQGQLMHTMGEVYHHLGLDDRATPLLERAYEILDGHSGPRDPHTVASLEALVAHHEALGNTRRADELRRRAVDPAPEP